MRRVAIINESTEISDDDVRAMIPAFEHQINVDLAAAWAVEEMRCAFSSRRDAPPDAWWLTFLNDSDQAGNLAYHDLTDEGLPLSKVFVRSLREDHASVTVGATHELCEMAVDPWLNGAYQSKTGTFWAGEVCDPVEDDRYGYRIGDILVTDFVTPAWFAYAAAATTFDFKQHVRAAFDILSGGYAQKYEHNRGWIQETGDIAKRSLRSHAAPGSRRDRRTRGASAWCKSERRA